MMTDYDDGGGDGGGGPTENGGTPPASSFSIDGDDDDDDDIGGAGITASDAAAAIPVDANGGVGGLNHPSPPTPSSSSRPTAVESSTTMVDVPPTSSAKPGPAYHPEFMFCGDCTSCAPPPPPMMPGMMTMGGGPPPPGGMGGMGGKKKKWRGHRMKSFHRKGGGGRKMTHEEAAAAADSLSGAHDDDASEIELSGVGSNGDMESGGGDANNGLVNGGGGRMDSFESDYVGEEKKDGGGDLSRSSSFGSSVGGGGATHRSQIAVANLTDPSQILVIKSILQPDRHRGPQTSALDPAVDLKDDVRNLKDGNPPGSPRGRRNAKKISGSVLSNGVEKVTVDLGGKIVTVDHDPLIVPASAIVSRLRALDYDASLLKDGASDLVPSSSNPTPHATARTQLYVAGICCASEVPAVTSILRRHPKGGVKKVNINIPARYVYVDHDPFVVTAGDLADELNEEGFGAKVRRDGGRNVPKPGTQPSPATAAENAAKKSDGEAAKAVNGGGGNNNNGGAPPPPGLHSGEVRSSFAVLVPKIGRLKNSDIPKIQEILSKIRGVTRIGVNVQYGMVYADHEHGMVDALAIRSTLERGGYPTEVERDGGADRLRELEAERVRNAGGTSAADSSALRGTSGGTTSTVPGIGTVASSKYVESTLMLPYLDDLVRVRRLEKFMSRHFVRAQVRAFYPNVPSRTVKVEHDPRYISAPAIAEAMRHEGSGPRGKGGGNWYDRADVVVDGAVEGLALPLMEDYDESEVVGKVKIKDEADEGLITKTFLGGLHVNVILSGIFWVVSMCSLKEGWENLKYAGLLSVAFGIPPVAAKAYRTLRRCQFDANCMMVVAAFGALALREYDEAASVAFLFAVSEWLEARATAKARRALGAIVSLRPDHANVVDPATGRVVVVPASNVPVGSRVSVRTGDKIPADGVVAEGTSTVDESSLTGEARPVDKRPGDPVSGGSINIGLSQLVVRTTSTVDDSAVSRLIRLVEEAQANRSPTEKIVDSFAKKYTPTVVMMAGLMCTIPWFWGREVGRYWTLNGLIIIVIACPCALTISTPVTYAAGLAATAQRGVIVKGGARLESLGNVKTIVFDKTGTLTEGKFKLIHLQTVGDRRRRQELLQLLATIEAPSSHPMSATLVDAAKREGVLVPKDTVLTGHTILKGEGVTADIDGRTVFVGNERLFRRLGMYDEMDPAKRNEAEGWAEAGGTVGFLGTEDEGVVGTFCVSDGVREEAREVVAALQEDGKEVIMLTGDGEGAARAVGREVGLPDANVHSQLLPEDKLHFVGSLKSTGGKKSRVMCGSKELVLMCGDGVNDAPALAVSDVGVAMGEGAALAMEMSDVTLMDSNLTKLHYCIKMGGRVIRTIRENIVFSLVAKLLVVGLTFAGKMTLLLAIAADVGVMLIVTLNGMKLLPGRNRVTLQSEQLTPTRKGKYDGVPLGGSSGHSDQLPDVV